MAIHYEHEDYAFALRRDSRRRGSEHDEDHGTPPRLADTLIELALMAAGFAGVILLVYAVLGAFR